METLSDFYTTFITINYQKTLKLSDNYIFRLKLFGQNVGPKSTQIVHIYFEELKITGKNNSCCMIKSR